MDRYCTQMNTSDNHDEQSSAVKLASGSYDLIQKDLGIADELDFDPGEDPFGQLHAFLTPRIQHLLDHDFGYLINAMYRIDISEEVLKEILEHSKPGQIASDIAERVIAREKMKMETRMMYSGNKKM